MKALVDIRNITSNQTTTICKKYEHNCENCPLSRLLYGSYKCMGKNKKYAFKNKKIELEVRLNNEC